MRFNKRVSKPRKYENVHNMTKISKLKFYLAVQTPYQLIIEEQLLLGKL